MSDPAADEISESAYNPLDYKNLTMNLVRELMSRSPVSLDKLKAFRGPGVYALFYAGRASIYSRVVSSDASLPIYVGKAVPPGARKGAKPTKPAEQEKPLFSRLREHAESIGATRTLKVEDFLCRYLVVVPLWITMAERFLMEHYQPVWNVCIEGFGNHDPGKGRLMGKISWWDILHPGRPWAKNLEQGRTQEEATKRLGGFLDLKKPS